MMTITTDTATVCLYDLECLKHRKDDVCDWWTIPEDAIDEINLGNVLILGLGTDGFYDVRITDQPTADAQSYELNVPSGRLYLGAGEDISGGGLEPDGSWGGQVLEVEPGVYTCWVFRNAKDEIEISLKKGGTGRNHVTDFIRL